MKKRELYSVISNLVPVAAVIIAAVIYGGVKLAEKIRETWICNNAARSAEAYFCEKYGYESAAAEVSPYNPSSAAKGEHYVIVLNITAGDESSMVIAYSNEGSIHFTDTFQYEQIIEAVSDEISESIPGARAVSMDIFAFESMTGGYWGGYFEEYYNGENLDKVLEGGFGHMEIVLADSGTDASEVKESLAVLSEKWDFEVRKLKVTYFDTEENMEKFIEAAREKGNTYYLYDTYFEHIVNDFYFSDNP